MVFSTNNNLSAKPLTKTQKCLIASGTAIASTVVGIIICRQFNVTSKINSIVSEYLKRRFLEALGTPEVQKEIRNKVIASIKNLIFN